MIALVQGNVLSVEEKSITVLTQSIGLSIFVPNAQSYTIGSTITLHTYLHWHADNGPLLTGFATELEKRVFLLIIECPKIGPSIGLAILGQISPHNFLELVQSQNSKGLSKLHGIGPKKAEQIILELKNKIAKIWNNLALEASTVEHQQFLSLQEVGEALGSLNYSKQEIAQALAHLGNNAGTNASFDALLRSALAFLSSASLN